VSKENIKKEAVGACFKVPITRIFLEGHASHRQYPNRNLKRVKDGEEGREDADEKDKTK
jgi:hypothetical protein